MSTHSRIGIEGAGGRVTSVYCHYDGYPSGVGKVLLAHWASAERAVALMQHGDLSQLEGPEFAAPGSREGGKVVAYRLWRNEVGHDPRADTSRDAFVQSGEDWDIEYHYLYGPEGWEVDQHDEEGFVPLTPALIARNGDAG